MQKNNVKKIVSGLFLSTVATSAVQASPLSYDGTEILFEEHYYTGEESTNSALNGNKASQKASNYNGTEILFEEHYYPNSTETAKTTSSYHSFESLNTNHDTFLTNIGFQLDSY